MYDELVEAFGLGRVFILSAGWGLLAADFLTPRYDITFSSQAEPYKRRRMNDGYADLRMLPSRRDGTLVFLGGKDYMDLFQRLTSGFAGNRIVFYNSDRTPTVPGCSLVRFETTTRTNWHYECARALLAGEINVPA